MSLNHADFVVILYLWYWYNTLTSELSDDFSSYIRCDPLHHAKQLLLVLLTYVCMNYWVSMMWL